MLLGGFLYGAQLLSAQPASAPGEKVTLVRDETLATPAQQGIGKLKLALQQKGLRVDEVNSVRMATNGTVVVAGLTTGPGEAAKLIADLGLTPQDETQPTKDKPYESSQVPDGRDGRLRCRAPRC